MPERRVEYHFVRQVALSAKHPFLDRCNVWDRSLVTV